MNAYFDLQLETVNQIQAKRRAEAAVDRLRAELRRGRHQDPGGWGHDIVGLLRRLTAPGAATS